MSALTSPTFQLVRTNGVDLRVAVAGEMTSGGPLIILVHGFPESWYSWRHQMAPLAAAGYRVAAIDVRGYGGSDKPHQIDAYTMAQVTADVAGIADALGGGQAILVGHDWGALIVWHTALLYPNKISAVAALSVPYTGALPAPYIDIVKSVFTAKGRFFYQVYFQDEGVAEAELEADVRTSLRKFYYALSGDAIKDGWPADKKHGDSMLHRLVDPAPFPAWLTDADIDYYTAEFEQSGFRGPLNRYRTSAADFAFLWDKAAGRTDDRIHQPALYVGGDRDLVLKMIPGADLIAQMRDKVPNLHAAPLLEGCGHWTQQERPDAVNAHLLAWLATLDTAP